MSFARDTYTASAAQTDFTITFPYIAATHVQVYKDGTLQTVGAANDYTLADSTTVRFNSGLTGGEVVILLRNSSQSSRLVDYTDAGGLTETTLDLDGNQAFYMAQEALDGGLTSALGLNAEDQWDATSKVITEVSAPEEDTDAVNKEYVDDLAFEAGSLPSALEANDDQVLTVTEEGAVAWAKIDEANITALGIDTAQLAAESVTSAKIEDGAVDEEHFAEEAVDTADIADEAVTLAKLEDNSGGRVVAFDEAGAATVIAPSTAGYVMTSNGPTEPVTFQSPGGNIRGDNLWGAVVGTGTNYAKTGLSSTSLKYMRIALLNVLTDADAEMYLSLGTTGPSYSTVGAGCNAQIRAASQDTDPFTSGVATIIGNTWGSSSGLLNGVIEMFKQDFSGADEWHIRWQISVTTAGNDVNHGAGYIQLAADLDAVKLSLSTGNFVSGATYSYGG